MIDWDDKELSPTRNMLFNDYSEKLGYVTIVVRYWTTREDENDLYYHGHITGFDHLRDGIWARLDDQPKMEEFFHFGNIEAVIDGDRIPFLAGTTKRVKKESAE